MKSANEFLGLPAANPERLNEAMRKLGENLSKKPLQDKPTKAPKNETQLSLEFWPTPVRKLPNSLLRGALFGVYKIRPVSIKREIISSLKGVIIKFKGERFNQTDLDVLEMLLHYGREKPLGTIIEFSAHQILNDLDRAIGGDGYEQLAEEMARLAAGLIEITWIGDKKTFGGTPLRNYYRDEKTQRYAFTFDEKIMLLYEQGATYIEIDNRLKLGVNSLAKWLYRFYLSHQQPLDYKVETLKDLCGSTVARLGDFRKALKVSLDLLIKNNLIASWSINPDNDHVKIIHIKKSQIK